jgi:calcineurin-like phosphoesterase family protein
LNQYTVDLNKQFGNVFFSADPHFNHFNIIRFCNRPFTSIQEMDDAIIANYNQDVGPDDLLIIIGDFAAKQVREYRERINCNNVWLITGNHDKNASYKPGPILRSSNVKNGPIFQKVDTLCQIDVIRDNTKQQIVLCHYPMRAWPHSHRGSWMLFGHVHNMMPDDPDLLSIDVGVDAHNYRAISFDQVSAIMTERKKTWKPDHIRWAEKRSVPVRWFKDDPSLQESEWTE